MAVRRRARTNATELLSFEECAYEWLSSREGEIEAKRLIRQFRIPLDPKELTSDAMQKIFALSLTNPDHFRGENWENGRPDHYSITIMRNLLRDILRGRKSSPLQIIEERDGGHFDSTDDVIADTDVLLHDGSPSDSGPGGGELIDRLRVELETSGAKPWIISAALSAFTLSAFDDVDTGKSPTPEAGAKPEHARLWPSLWFAGERGAFDVDGTGSPAAVRRLRSRRMRDVSDLMLQVRSRCGLEDRS